MQPENDNKNQLPIIDQKLNQNYSSYKGNPNLIRAGYKKAFTKEQMDEYLKCAEDPIYFIKKYVKIIHVDRGLIPFELWGFQERLINTLKDNRFVIGKIGRQSGKTMTLVAYLLHFTLFNDNKMVAILGNKGATAREILSRYKLAYENLPQWMQQGAVSWNKGDLELENGSKVLAAATSASAIRGYSFSAVVLDEFAFVQETLAEEFFTSVYPTISSGKETKLFIISTPKGLNHFYRMWREAEDGRSNFVKYEAHWSEVPGRDETWKELTIKNTSARQFAQEYGCSFLGSQDTLIEPDVLAEMKYDVPLSTEMSESLKIYEYPKEDSTYVMAVDSARGVGQDYSAFSVFDVTHVPYVQVATYKNNNISPMLFPSIVNRIGLYYNNAFLLIETNDIGAQVADILHNDLEYTNIMKIAKAKRGFGQQISSGHQKTSQFGIKMSSATKKIGCANLKTIIESEKLIIKDYDTISELTTFIAVNDSFEADEGKHDDMVSTCILFGWLTAQFYFRDATGNNIREALERENSDFDEGNISGLMSPIYSNDHSDEFTSKFIDTEGTLWTTVFDEKIN